MDVLSLSIIGILFNFREIIFWVFSNSRKAHYIWHASYYIFISIFYIFIPERDFFDFSDTTVLESIYFTTQLSFYLIGISFMIIDRNSQERNHNDFHRMVIHHAVTIVLISLSIVFRYHAIASYVMFIHDVGDIFLNIAKIFYKTSIDIIFFVCFTLCFVIGRFYFLPVHVIVPCFEYTREHNFLIQHIIALSGLSILIILHIFWFFDIMGVIYGKKEYGKLKDSRKKKIK